MDKVTNLIQRNWYFQGFNAVPALLYGPAWSMVRDMPDLLGFGYSACIQYFKDDVCYYSYAWDDLFRIRDEILKRYKADPNYIKYLALTDKKICKEVMNKYKKFSLYDNSNITKQQLFAYWREVNNLCSHLLSVSHLVEGFSLTTEDNIRKLVEQEFPGDLAALSLLTTPSRHSFLSVEHYSLCLIARSIRLAKKQHYSPEQFLSDKEINKKISAHQKKYFWKLNSYTSAKYLTNKDFADELYELFLKKTDFEKFIKEYETLSERIKRKREKIKKINNRELIDLLSISNIVFDIHDRRKECLTQSITYLEKILSEIAIKFTIPVGDLSYIRSSELEKLPGIWSELKKRRKNSIYILLPNGEVPVMLGVKAREFFIKASKQKKLEDTREIKGYGASLGKARGIVKVCRGEKELAKVEHGNILVACMTQPEFLPALKKAAAIITDEGGVTCHAAIVSRELGIPCVIGTKIATRVLKDGDEVEVNANHGVIKIIK